MSRFVRPQMTTLKISGGDTLVVKQRLNHGEQFAAYDRMYLAGVDGKLHTHPLKTGMAMITAYLLDWSLTDDDGKPVVIRDQPIEAVEAALNALEHESFIEIKQAIETHESTQAKAREQEKKLRTGPIDAGAISPSPSGADGPLTTSVN